MINLEDVDKDRLKDTLDAFLLPDPTKTPPS